MNEYINLQNRHQKEFNDFPMFFAFNEEQFAEGMAKLGLKETDTNKIYTIGYGGYIRKSDSSRFEALMKKHRTEKERAITNDVTGEGYIKQMFEYELANHEYGYTRDLAETLEALDLTIAHINKSKSLKRGLTLALRRYR